MLLYLIIVLITMLISIGSSIAVSFHASTSLFHAICTPLFVNFYALAILGILAFVLRFCIPFKAYNFDKKIFKVSKSEIKVYERLKIKSWKDKIPKMGKAGGFSKKHFTSTDLNYLKNFLNETCFAEVLHFLAGILPFTALFLFSMKVFYFVLLILIVNLILHLLP